MITDQLDKDLGTVERQLFALTGELSQLWHDMRGMYRELERRIAQLEAGR